MRNSTIDRLMDVLSRLILAGGVLGGVIIAGRLTAGSGGLGSIVAVAGGIFLPVLVIFPALIRMRSLVDRKFRPYWYRAGVLIDWASGSEESFRSLVKDLFLARGYEVEETAPPASFIASGRGEQVLVQAIGRNVEVRQGAIDELAAVAEERRCGSALLVTAGRFSHRALRVGHRRVGTVDRKELQQWVAEAVEEAPGLFPAVE